MKILLCLYLKKEKRIAAIKKEREEYLATIKRMMGQMQTVSRGLVKTPSGKIYC